MAAIWIKEFIGGLDTRRMPVTTPGGALIDAVDGHITQGGEFEKRAAFVPTYVVPPTTVGLSKDTSGLVVFGNLAAPIMPSGVAYQRLARPSDPSATLINVPSTDLYGGKIYAVGEFAAGFREHFYNGAAVTDWFDGRARASFRIVSGTAASATIDTITVDGFNIMGSAVLFDTDTVTTAEAIAAEINSYSSVPEYEASFDGDTVTIVAGVTGAAFNGRVVQINVGGDMIVTPTSGLYMNYGADSTGTFTPGRFVLTNDSKMYSTANSTMHFSGVGAPTEWTTDVVGAGFIDMASQASGAEALIGLAKYQNFLAVFAKSVTMIWNVDPDPSNNRIVQTLNNTGTSSPLSITQFGDNDLFYLHTSGLRSLRARDASNAASTTDLGVPVDGLIRAQLRTLTADEIDKITGLIEPGEGRFWLIVKDTIYVFSFFSGAKISSWSIYRPGFEVDAAVVYDDRVYLRSGTNIYCYGGTGAEPTFDDVGAVAQLPYLDGGKPTQPKKFDGFDVAVEGTWLVEVGFDPTALDVLDTIGTFSQTTYGKTRISMTGEATHISVRLTSQGPGPAKLGALVISYDGDAKND